MNPTAAARPPQLAAPGAGLPKIELFFARLMVRWKARHTDRPAATAAFAVERDAILRLAGDVAPEHLAKQVLIKRLPGLEDSSRFWSVLMTLDHLRIVNKEIAGVIAGLGAGQPPQRAASTAAVKPSGDVDHGVIAAFEKGCRDFEQSVEALKDLKTTARFAHPWFGLMDASEWHFMTGFHMMLHRRQIERILAEL